MNTALNVSVVMQVANKSGGELGYGDVVIPSSADDRSVTTTVDTTYRGPVGVVIDPGGIAPDAIGAVVFQGFCPRINLLASASRTSGLVISASAGRATISASSSGSIFGLALTEGTTPEAVLFGRVPVESASTPGYEAVGGRLTLTSGTPVTVSDVTGAATLYYTPCEHGRIGLYYGGAWELYSTDEISISLGAISDATNYDVFAYYTGLAVALEIVAWASASARTVALARQDGIYVKLADATRRYLGTIRASGAGTCEDSAAKRFVWNAYNRRDRALCKTPGDTTINWTYASNTPRPANNDSTWRVEIVLGLQDVLIDLTLSVVVNQSTEASARVWINEDSVSSDAAQVYEIGRANHGYAKFRKYPAVGYHYYQWMEQWESGTLTFYHADEPIGYYSGILGAIEG